MLLTIAAAVLVLGVLIGRYSRRGTSAAEAPVANVARVDSVAVPEPYQSTTSQYLGQTAALLVALPAEIRNGRADAQFIDHAHDLLLTTRLLLDSPAASDAQQSVIALFETNGTRDYHPLIGL